MAEDFDTNIQTHTLTKYVDDLLDKLLPLGSAVLVPRQQEACGVAHGLSYGKRRLQSMFLRGMRALLLSKHTNPVSFVK
jgi:hypothetical protein